jgi:hypothetical protein
MSFNSLMALLTRGTLDYLEARPSVLELGNQTLRASDEALRLIIERSAPGSTREPVDIAGLQKLVSQGEKARGERAADYYRLLGFSNYTAIDVNDNYGSLIMDLNKDLREAYGYKDTFSLVTNNGTGEHVFNQHTIYRNAHQLTKAGGIMIHSQPFIDYINHGFYSIHPNLYHALAVANGYDILAMGVSTRDGYGIIALGGEALRDQKTPILAKETRVSLGVLLSSAKIGPRGPRGWLKRFAGNADGRRFGAEVRRLQRNSLKLMSFAILRKPTDSEFQIPIQTVYEPVVQDDGLRSEYGLESTA